MHVNAEESEIYTSELWRYKPQNEIYLKPLNLLFLTMIEVGKFKCNVAGDRGCEESTTL